MALKNYDYNFDQAGYDALQAELDARFSALEGRADIIEKYVSIVLPEEVIAEPPSYTEGTFAYTPVGGSATNFTFARAAFMHPTFGYLKSDNIAANVGGNYPGTTITVASILEDLLERNAPFLQVVA